MAVGSRLSRKRKEHFVPHPTKQTAVEQPPANHRVVIDQTGLRGLIDAQALDAQGKSQGETQITITYGDNRQVQAPVALLQPQPDGTYHLPRRLRDLAHTAAQDELAAGVSTEHRIPVIREELRVDKRQVETGHVRVTKQVQVTEETVDTLVNQQTVQVERIPIDQLVDTAPTVRYEGETLVIPVLEEVMVVEKRLRLKEEVRITYQVETVEQQTPVTLRREEVVVARTDPHSPPPDPR